MPFKVSPDLIARFIGWLIFACLIGYEFAWVGNAETLTHSRQLNASSITVNGTVVSFERGNALAMAQVDYRFSAEGKSLTGEGPIDDDRAARLSSGKSIPVHVLPGNPSVNAVDIGALQASAHHSILFALLMEVIVAVVF